MADLIDRQKIKARFEPWLKVKGYSEGELNMLKAVLYEITVMPSAQPDVPDTNVGDMISRQAAIDTVRSYYDECDEREESIEERIERLPSAERHGKWIHDGYDFPHGVDWMHCSECGKIDVYCPAARTNFCPNCGARMDGEQDG